MCLSNVYKNEISDENLLISNVSRIDVDGDKITLTDLMEREMVVMGHLVSLDLVGAKVLLRPID